MLNVLDHKGMQIKLHCDPATPQARMADIEKTNDDKGWRGCVEKDPSHTVGGNIN
jgi:hypothetical protein